MSVVVPVYRLQLITVSACASPPGRSGAAPAVAVEASAMDATTARMRTSRRIHPRLAHTVQTVRSASVGERRAARVAG